jgi:hypothetical protein
MAPGTSLGQHSACAAAPWLRTAAPPARFARRGERRARTECAARARRRSSGKGENGSAVRIAAVVPPGG